MQTRRRPAAQVYLWIDAFCVTQHDAVGSHVLHQVGPMCPPQPVGPMGALWCNGGQGAVWPDLTVCGDWRRMAHMCTYVARVWHVPGGWAAALWLLPSHPYVAGQQQQQQQQAPPSLGL